MSEDRKALLLVGSPKARGSVSRSLGEYLVERLAALGWGTETVRIAQAMRSEAGRAKLLAAALGADLLVLSFPLYVDSLPAPVIEAMEMIATARPASGQARAPRMVALANCGFPEAKHNDVSLAICRRFAKEAGIEWAGGLSLGAGPSLGGAPLRQLGGRVGGIVRALDLTAAALDGGGSVPEEAVRLVARPMMPLQLYVLVGNLGWWWQARRNGVLFRLGARPLAR
ncbi:MAG: NAD(P)H-dependent oxidoreductase [Anaerolineae bacterium]